MICCHILTTKAGDNSYEYLFDSSIFWSRNRTIFNWLDEAFIGLEAE